MKINWKDAGVGGIIVIVIFSFLSISWPVVSVETCTGDCSEAGITNCSCTVSQMEPFPYYFILRLLLPLLSGLLFYIFRNKSTLPVMLAILAVFIMILIATYFIFYTIFPSSITNAIPKT
jgi:cytochrome bd-type quinol oxidase subunit 2